MADPTTEPEIRVADLVLEGGGVKGIALVGAIAELEAAGYRFRRVAGTSAGALVGAMVAAGMSAAEMRVVMDGLDWSALRDPTSLGRVPVIGRALSLLFHQGINEGAYLHDLVATYLSERGVETFADLREDDPGSALPPALRYKLIVHVADVSRSRLLRLPWDYEPDLGLDPDDARVADAVRASASIPFFFRPVKIQPAVGPESWLVDGGMLTNFPIGVFDRRDGQPPRWPTIGIALSAAPDRNAVRHRVHDLVTFTEAIIGTLTSWFDRLRTDDPDIDARTVFVDTGSISATDFSITAAQRGELFESGRNAARAWLRSTHG